LLLQIGIFSIASYPYSFKLLWSPIVDAIYSRSLGRRKSWIIPLQLSSVVVMLACAPWADSQLAAGNVRSITLLFFILVLLAATQDIAVDGWALTLLSRRHVGYAASPSDVMLHAFMVCGAECRDSPGALERSPSSFILLSKGTVMKSLHRQAE
jgi:hypothetical protein